MPYVHTCASHMEEITGKFLHIYRSCFMLQIDPSRWNESVSNGLGADISLPPCLATGIWNLTLKATSGPKSRGASFGTTLWRRVQRYCARFLLFMVIYGNLVHWGYNWNRQKPSLSCPGLFWWTLESCQTYCKETASKTFFSTYGFFFFRLIIIFIVVFCFLFHVNRAKLSFKDA